MHWRNKWILENPKGMGGLGIRNVSMFNRALLYKYAWRCEMNKDSILARIYKGKYGCLPLNAGNTGIIKPHWSWGFKGICRVAKEFHKGTRWRLGSGKDINTIKDRWTQGCNVNFKPQISEDRRKELSTVDSLIDPERRVWKQNVIWNSFPRSDAQSILNTYIPEVKSNDEQSWAFTPSGRYTVKSGYAFLINECEMHGKYRDTSKIWKHFWVINTLHKWKVFIWRLCNNALPTKQNINQRGIPVDPICVFCNKEQENAAHLFRDCEWATRMWLSSPLGINTRAGNTTSIKDWTMQWITKITKDDIPYYDTTNNFFAGFWAIWKHRNEVIFRGVDPNPNTVMESMQQWTKNAHMASHNRVDHHMEPQRRAGIDNDFYSSIGMRDISNTSVTANVDGAWKVTDTKRNKCQAGIGWRIFNKNTDDTLHTMSMPIRCTSATDAEARGILLLLKWLKDKDYKEININTDCKSLIGFMKDIKEAPNYLKNIIEDILNLGYSFNYCKISYASRQATLDAHKLAIHARVSGLQQSS